MNISRGQWLLAIAVAGVAHLCLLGLFLIGDLSPRQPDEAPRGVMVSLDTLEPGLPPQSPAESAPIEAAQTETRAPSAPEPAPAASPQASADAVQQAPEAATDIGPQPAPGDQSDVADAPSPDASETSSPEDGSVAAPRVADAVTIRPQNVTEAIRPEEQVTARAADVSELTSTTTAPEQSNGASGSSEQATDDYIVRLRAWLSRHKQYPMAARNDEVEGTVRLYLVIDANGNIINTRILDGSGSDMLDEAARQMVARSQPLPRMPASMRRNRLELVVPVVFSLR
ncbi:energy transducer TonB [Salinisphaera aquimarina]|uniref:Energy transducer TonB n=1 Tax=Salinisphaera aquimarina TaxID=2094031 RepID=A0ABV7EPU1_9GAMM